MRVASATRRDERAFTIVEVIIAALIVTAVLAGAVYFMVGAGKSQQGTMVRQRMASSADGIIQQVRSERTWLEATPSCRTATCDVSARFQPKPGNAEGPALRSRVTISPVDSDVDRVGFADEDGVRPDFYRIEVVVSLAPGEAQEWGRQQDFETVSTVDATALGLATGTLVVQTGETSNQVDDRMAISSVTSGGDQVDMRRQVEPCASPFPLTFDEWSSRRPTLPLGCNDAFDAAASRDAYMTRVDLRAVNNVPFTIRRDTSDGGPAVVRRSSDADGGGAGANGQYTFSGIPAGSYRVVVTPPRGRELWRTKMSPSNGISSVQANQKAQALVMVRPVQGTGRYNVQLTRDVYIYELTTETDSVVGTFTQSGVTVQVTTNYVYLVAKDPRREEWAGPAWNGLLVMEPKPFDRYRMSGTGVGASAQRLVMGEWTGENLYDAPARHPNRNGWYTLDQLPTGLSSSPKQQPDPIFPTAREAEMWGRFDANDPQTGRTGRRTQDCNTSLTPGGSCGDFAWMSHRPGTLGEPNGSIRYHSPFGECYIESAVSGVIIPRRLQNGAERSARCSRTFLYVNTVTGNTTAIPNFLPDKNGNGGGRMVLRMWQTSACVAGCGDSWSGGTGTIGTPDPSSGGTNPTVGSRNGPPPQTFDNAPPINVTTRSPTPGSPPRTQSIGAAPAVAMPQTK
jgi:type II secretory pathway pseudopilin PulG